MVFEFDINSDSSETTDLLVKILQISIYYLFTLFIIFIHYFSMFDDLQLQ